MLLREGITGSEGEAAAGSMAGKAVGYRQSLEWLLKVGEGWVRGAIRWMQRRSAVCGCFHLRVDDALQGRQS